MLAIGADRVIDYMKEDFTRNGQRYDMILDVVAYHSTSLHRITGDASVRTTRASQPVAPLLDYSRPLLLEKLFSPTGSKQLSILAHKAKRELDTLIELFEAGKVVSLIDRRFPPSEVAEASNTSKMATLKVIS